jgi:hypothetical protein
MHLQGYPKYYTKDGRRRPVYYTADARDLTAMGWKPEESKSAKVDKAEKVLKTDKPAEVETPSAVEKIEVEVVEDEPKGVTAKQESELPDFEFMTKPELLEYASQRGVELPINTLKSELVKTCRNLVNG